MMAFSIVFYLCIIPSNRTVLEPKSVKRKVPTALKNQNECFELQVYVCILYCLYVVQF